MDGPTIGDPGSPTGARSPQADPEPTFTFTPTAEQVGKTVRFRADAIPSGTTDLILSVTAPDGTDLGTIDTGSSPETLAPTLDQPGTYTITVSGFDGDTGDFTVDVVAGARPLEGHHGLQRAALRPATATTSGRSPTPTPSAAAPPRSPRWPGSPTCRW